jgi:hypothetical protein
MRGLTEDTKHEQPCLEAAELESEPYLSQQAGQDAQS